MIELVVDAINQVGARAMRVAIGNRRDVTVMAHREEDLLHDVPLDALVMDIAPASEIADVRVPRSLETVVTDIATDTRVLVYEAEIFPARRSNNLDPGGPSWIVVLAQIAGQVPMEVVDPAIREAVTRGEQFLNSADNLDAVHYVRYLNALEVIERHNASGNQAPICRVAFWAIDDSMISSLLRAYDEYRGRLDLPRS